MAAVEASLLSLCCPSSPFKGNLTGLKPKACNFTCLKLHSKKKRPLVIISQAAAAASVVTTSPGGRGISAGQGNSCGFGMRGQKSRSGPGVRKGFEGGQVPLYRRIPKLRGIAGEWLTLRNTQFWRPLRGYVDHIISQIEWLTLYACGVAKICPCHLKDITAAGFQEGDEVSLETLKEKGLINPSGRERTLPLKVLGDGELSVKLNIKARAFSAAAKEKLEAAGCSLTVLPGRKKWVKPSVAKNLARAEEYFAKKRAAAAASEPTAA
ncbi:hypothetical protein BDE02_10G110600 [Populus trichocarpa]|nr:hypothetical protein BDE02_10G110600 [Populus trichocarpa]